MNRWLAATLLLSFLFLATFSIIFGKKIRSFDPPLSVTPTKTQETSPGPEITKEQNQQLSVVATNLEIPWGIAFLPDGSMLFTERPGRVRYIDANHNLESAPIMTLSDVNATGEGGLLGVAADPQFATNKFVYFYYSYGNGASRMYNRVVRYVFDGKRLRDQKIIVDGIPGNSNHDGGRIKFGPDGYLYMTTGDSQDPSLAQDKSSFAGKILRVKGEGKVEVYSYGHRNPQGIAWDAQGRLWETEHGRSNPTGYDELNLIEQGKNYGWDTIQGDEKKEGMVTPILNSGPTTTWAPSGAAFYNGSIFFGGLRGQGLYEAVLSGDTASLKKHFDGKLGRIRDVVLGPDNMLYITTSNRDGRGLPQANDDKIYRVNPAKL